MEQGALHFKIPSIATLPGSSGPIDAVDSTRDQSMPLMTLSSPLAITNSDALSSLTSRSASLEPAPRFKLGRNTTPRRKVQRRHILTKFGHIPGIPVGATWLTRLECSRHGVHAHSLAGIHGRKDEGCYSIVMSGAYEDDIDEGDWFTYTGTGGRVESSNRGKLCEELPQTFDQTFDHPHNASLLQSYVTRNPVRVVRGFKTAHGPQQGYRYDGLYIVQDASYVAGKHGHQVCTFTFRRMDGQDPLPSKLD